MLTELLGILMNTNNTIASMDPQSNGQTEPKNGIKTDNAIVPMVLPLKRIEFHSDGRLHRLDGPAIIFLNHKEEIRGELWCNNGKRHRTDGPALIGYTLGGEIDLETYYVYDYMLSKETFDGTPSDRKSLLETANLLKNGHNKIKNFLLRKLKKNNYLDRVEKLMLLL